MIALTFDTTALTKLATSVVPELARQIPYATSRALNDSAIDVRNDLRDEMDAKFDRPTPWVKRGVVVAFSNKADLTARVYFNPFGGSTPTSRVLKPHVGGGGRNRKRHEHRIGSYAMPGSGARLDKYGNMRGADIMRVLSALGTMGEFGQNQSAASRKRKSRAARNTAIFRQGNVIYERKGQSIAPLMVLTSAPSYTARLDWGDKAREVMSRVFEAHFEKRFSQAIATAKAK